jgi:hypothetical protein
VKEEEGEGEGEEDCLVERAALSEPPRGEQKNKRKKFSNSY